MIEDVSASAATDPAAAAQDPGTEEASNAQNQSAEVKTDLWMDFDVLYKCFK